LDVTTRLLAVISSGERVEAGGDTTIFDVVLPTEIVVRGTTDPSRTVY
jgi:hypothetical protein